MLSFKINKKTPTNSAVQRSAPRASTKAFHDDDDKEKEEPDFIHGLDGNQIMSKREKKVTKKEALVIPLIAKNEWRADMRKAPSSDTGTETDNAGNDAVTKSENSSASTETNNSLKQQAIKELLEGTSFEEGSHKSKNSSIPLLFQNRIPEGYEEDDNMDVSLRPEQSTLDDYERIPIQEFGLAMLRGMGWKETEGIGLRNKKVVEMSEPKLRPKGMGLGAEPTNKNIAPQASNTNNDANKEDLTFKIGGYAVITKGSKRGYYGQIESFDEDNNRVILRLSISGKMEAVSKFYINIVSATEYKKSSKVINSEKYEEYKSRQDEAERNRQEGRTENGSSSKSKSSKSRHSRSRSSSSNSSHGEKEHRSRSRKTDYDDYDEGKDNRKSERRHRDDRDYDRDYKSKETDKYKERESRRDDRSRSSKSRHHENDRDRSYKSDDHCRSDRDPDRHRKREEYDRDRERRRGHSTRNGRD